MAESTTPMPTATWMGRKSVARSVVPITIREDQPVAHTVVISPTRIDPVAATMSTAASVGTATLPTMPAKATRTASIHRPQKIEAHRDRAPALTFIAVWPDRSPDGLTLEEPGGDVAPALGGEVTARVRWGAVGVGHALADPRALDEDDDRDRQGARDESDVQQAEVRDLGEGHALGDVPEIRYPGHVEVGEGRDGGGDDEGDQRAEGPQPRASQAHEDHHRHEPHEERGTVDALRIRDDRDGLGEGRVTLDRRPGQVGDLPEDDVQPTPVRNPIITEWETNRV